MRLVDPALRRKRAEQRRYMHSLESPGRKVGAPIGSWITDLAEIKQTIIVCWECEPKWKRIAKRYHYAPLTRWNDWYGGAMGPCDGCRTWGPQRTCYVHGSNMEQVY